MAKGKWSKCPQNVTQMDVNQVCELAKAQGFTQVKTLAGFIPLDEWTPYGKRTGHNVVSFELKGNHINEIRTAITTTLDKYSTYTGVWELQ